MARDPRTGIDFAALDEHIAGGHYHRTEVTLRCSFCYDEGEADQTFSAYSEYGGTWLDEENEYTCPTHHADGSICPVHGDRWADKKRGCKAEHAERESI